MNAPYSARYRFHDVGLDLRADQSWLVDGLQPVLGPMLARPVGFAGPTASILVTSHPEEPELFESVRRDAEQRFLHFGTEGYSLDGDLWLVDDGAVIQLPEGSTEARAWVDETMRDTPEGYHRTLIVAIIELFRQLGLYQLHAGCVAKGDDCLLFCGGQRHGKSTATIAMALGNWGYVTDDLLYLRVTDRGIGGQGWREDFNVGEVTRAAFGLDDRVGHVRLDGRYAMDPSFLSAADDSTPVHPNHIIFTQVAPNPTSTLSPVTRGEALRRMVKHSPMVLAAGRQAEEHLAILQQLVLQCECLDLHAGQDVLAGGLPDLLEAHLAS